ncbi:hypothetical protein K2X85_19890 [bacterium]|nr:hypothetical protein [bacterium]
MNRRSSRLGRGLFALLFLSTLGGTEGAALENDPRIEYVEKLQQAGMPDLAVEYLRQLTSKPGQGQLSHQIDYYLAKALLDEAGQSSIQREQELIDEALRLFEKFRTDQPESLEAMDARGEITGIEVARAQRLLAEAKLASHPPSAQPLQSKALAALDKALPEVDGIIQRYEKLLAEEKPERDGDDRPRRRRGGTARDDRSARKLLIEGRKLDVELRRGMIDYLAGQAYDRADPIQKKLSDARLQASAAKFDELFQKYRATGTLAASLALLWQGRVRQELGDAQGAEDIYREVLAGEPKQTTGVDDIRADLFAQARLFWCQVKNQAGLPEEVINNRYYSAVEWLNRSASRRRERLGLGIQLELAKAYIALAEKKPADDKEGRRLIREAMKLLADGVCRYSSEFMPEGFALREKYAARVRESADEMTSFDEAAFVGGNALAAKDWAGAIDAYERAISLVKRDVDLEEVASVRYRLSLARIQAGQIEEGTKLANELAQEDPITKVSAEAAGLVVSARWKEYREANKQSAPDLADKREKLESALQTVKSRFPRSNQADTARFLTGFLLSNDKKYEASATAYEEVTPAGENFAESRLRAGQVLAMSFRQRFAQQEATVADATRPLELFAVASEAFAKQVTDTGPPPIGLVESRLAQARLLLLIGKPKEALDLLEPLLKIVEQGRSTGTDQFGIEVAVSAVEAALAAGLIDRAEKFVDAMLTGDQANPAGGDRVAAVLVRLGKSLQEDVDRFKKQGDASQAVSRQKALEEFLAKLANRPQQTVATLRYLADSYESLGQQAQAAATIEKGLALIKQSALPEADREKLVSSLQARRVRLLRESGDLSRAREEVETLLSAHRESGKKTFALSMEFERCEILEAMARKDANLGAQALAGWNSLSERLRGAKAKPREFFLARLGSARWTAQLQGPAAAIPILKSTLTLHPDAGGPAIKKEFEALLQQWGANRPNRS